MVLFKSQLFFISNNSTSIITRDKSLKKLNLYLWKSSSSSKYYVKMDKFCSSSSQDYCSKDILNVIPIDWDYNGYLDLIIIAKDQEVIGSQSLKAHFLLQYVQDIKSNECTTKGCELINVVSANIDSYTQPFIIPYENDQQQHLHGLFFYSTIKRQRVVLLKDPNNYQKLIQIDFNTLVEQNLKECKQYDLNEISERELANIHYSSVLDLNGDCRSDLFIHSQVHNKETATISDTFEFYIRLENGNFCLTKVYQIPSIYKVQSVGFTDANFDGGIDMVIMYNDPNQQYKSIMQIAFNNIIPSEKHLCSDRDLFSNMFGDLSNIQKTTSDILIMHYDFMILPANQTNFPSLRFGDFNLDGYNDLLMTVVNESDPTNSFSYFFENTHCNLHECKGLDNSHARYFQQKDTNSSYGLISQYKSVSASFFDFNENGQLDVILNTYEYNNETQQNVLSVKSIYNYLKTDSYFVKAFVMNGQQDGKADNDYTSSNLYGATVVCKVTTINEQIRPTKGIQLYQSAFLPLQLPYVIIGISRTNSYIEDLSVGLGLSNGDSIKSWNPIIPNSQINVYPNSNDPEKWNVNAFMVNVVESQLAILIIAAIIVVTLGIAIYYLFSREKTEDRREIEVSNLLI